MLSSACISHRSQTELIAAWIGTIYFVWMVTWPALRLRCLVLAMIGYKNVSLVDSNGKKINFVKFVSKKLDIKTKIFLSRIEKLNNEKFDFLTSRALANLNKLFTYSHKFTSNETVLIFLKGKTVKNEIKEAKNIWNFQSEIYPSYSDERGSVLVIKKLKFKI